MSLDLDPIDRFVEEHTRALSVLDRLERDAARLEENSSDLDAAAGVREALQFISTSVREHNEAEERALFPLLGNNAPTTVFVDDHGRLRTLERELELALAGASQARPVHVVSRAIIDLLKDHIRRENEMLFPLARNLLSAAELQEVARLRDAGA